MSKIWGLRVRPGASALGRMDDVGGSLEWRLFREERIAMERNDRMLKNYLPVQPRDITAGERW